MSATAAQVLKIIVPDRIDSIAALFGRSDESRVLRLVFGDEHDPATPAGFSRALDERRDDVLLGPVVHVLCRIETEPVEMELVYPVPGVLDEKRARRRRPFEVDRAPPVIAVFVGEVVGREVVQIVAVRSEVVVDDVQDHTKAFACARSTKRRRSSGVP